MATDLRITLMYSLHFIVQLNGIFSFLLNKFKPCICDSDVSLRVIL